MLNLKVSTGSTENVEVIISLECVNSGCSGLRTDPVDLKKTGSLTVISDFFQIISSGTFRVVANAYGYDSAYSTQVITVKNKVHRIESKFHINSAPCFTDAILTTKIYGEDDNLYVDYINLTYYRSFLNEKSRFQIITNKGQFQKTVYLTEVGYFYYKIYHNVTQDYNHLDINQGIHVYPNYIEIDRDEDSFPSNTRESFKFKIRITDNLYSNLIPKKPLNFFITVDPSTKLKGKSKKFTLKNGEATINDLIIPKSGSFQLQINCSTCINYTSESFNITTASCMIKAGPLFCLSILTFFMFFSLIFFSLSDRKILKDEEFEYSGFWRKFIKIYPLTGLLIKQPKNQRILISLQFFSSEILIFALIGAFCAYFDSSLERHEKSFIDCYQVQINKGAVGWTLAQVFIVPAFFLRFYAFGDRRLRIFSAAFDVFIAIVAGGVIFLVFFEFCITFSEYWTWNFVIFSVLDVSLMQSFYSFIALSIIHKKESKFLVYHENAEDFTDLQFSERDVKEEFKTFSQVDTGKQKKSNKNDFDGERIDHVV